MLDFTYHRLPAVIQRYPFSTLIILAMALSMTISVDLSVVSGQEDEPIEQTKVLLQELADQCKEVKLATEFTELIAQCQPLLKRQLTARQRGYVENVAAWAHGRRGELRLETAEQLLLAGNTQAKEILQTAIDDLSVAINADLDRWRLFLLRGVGYTHQANWGSAIEDFGQAIDRKPEDVRNWYNRGLAYLQLKQWELALTDLDTAASLAPQDLEILTARGHALLGIEQFEKALADFQEVVKMLPDDAAALVNLADALQSLKQWSQATERLQQVIQQKSKSETENSTITLAWQRLAWIKANCDDESIRDSIAVIQATHQSEDAPQKSSIELTEHQEEVK